jgi:hypothetical protein
MVEGDDIGSHELRPEHRIGSLKEIIWQEPV